ncbi:hypothetical protein [Nitrospira sp. BLG_2]|uniref:hypothetical protein n=1 Tax=Nitrospira sp. BLG_2 TaxID=3397507 RepID=UPI003B99C071
MSERSAEVELSEGVRALNMADKVIDEIVMRVINKLYDDNISLADSTYVRTYMLRFGRIERRIAVFVTEEKGVDKALVITKEDYDKINEDRKLPPWPTKKK